ncbi:hypothetical protein [Reyranella sp.]|uniref:hypothetical protein n=1 Tax=Reyranella sp. TaxID=1929291 RepID=UPI003BA85FE1
MIITLDTRSTKKVENYGGSWELLPRASLSTPPDLGLRIVRRDDKEVEFVLHGAMIDHEDGQLIGQSIRTANEIVARSNECRLAWLDSIVGLSVPHVDRQTQEDKYAKPFQDAWDQSTQPELLATAAPKLALAGNRLFMAIFEGSGNEDLKVLAAVLRAKLAFKSCHLAITSSEIFPPWGMMYTHPTLGERLAADGTNWRKEGFWGYQHLVHQNPVQVRLPATGRLDPAAPALLSVNFDDRLATNLNLPIIDCHIDLIQKLVAEPRIRRTKKSELAQDFTTKRESLESILYFYCHGKGIGADAGKAVEPHLIFTDGEVNAGDFEYWSDGDKPLSTSPLIFINACQGGQMQTLFYESFAITLLKQGAIGLVGAQVDVPAVFAAEYGHQVFSAFFTKSKQPVRMGPLLQKVNRVMWDDYKNPLGLVYSLYRGVNCYIDWEGTP